MPDEIPNIIVAAGTETAGTGSQAGLQDRSSPLREERDNFGLFSRLGRWVVSFPARGLLALVWLYQRTLSPVLPVVLGPSCGCRFAPTCSHYAAEAVRTHGALLGSLLAARRLLKCSPLHPGGFDPVPRTVRLRPFCHRSAVRSTESAPVETTAHELTA